jgi:hypothetical protein
MAKITGKAQCVNCGKEKGVVICRAFASNSISEK